jgi:hypothetical protein
MISDMTIFKKRYLLYVFIRIRHPQGRTNFVQSKLGKGSPDRAANLSSKPYGLQFLTFFLKKDFTLKMYF